MPDTTLTTRETVTRDETATERYARHTRNAAVFIAWVVGIIAITAIVVGIIAGVQLGHIANDTTGNTTTDCQTSLSC